MPPKRPNFVLSAYIPHIELSILVRHSLHIEADGRNCRDVGVELELVQNRYTEIRLINAPGEE